MAIRCAADYPALQKVLESNERMVCLCGAGASMALGDCQNSWRAWLYTGRDLLLPAQLKAFDALEGSPSSHELITAASYLLDSLKTVGRYTNFMDKTIGSLHPSNPEMMAAFQNICRAGDLAAAINYDLLVGEAAGIRYVTYETPRSQAESQGFRPKIQLDRQESRPVPTGLGFREGAPAPVGAGALLPITA